MYSDIFNQITETLTMQQVAERYGFEIHRGNNIHCPFHDDKHPDLRIYPGTRGWYCFGCNRGGSVIDFVSQYFEISLPQAALRLDNDFHLGLSIQRPDARAARQWAEERRKKQAEQDAFRTAYMAKITEFRGLWHMTPPPPETPQENPIWGEYAAKLGRRAELDNWLNNTEWR